jgi:shikimate dehydrogenase
VKRGRALLNAGVRRPIIHDADDSRVTRLIWLVADLGNGRVSGGQPNPTRCNLVCNATPMGLAESDWLPVPAELLVSSTFVGDVIAGNGVTPFLKAARAAGCKTANGVQMVDAAQEMMLDFMLVS